MTYSAGTIIDAADYNGFANDTANTNVNNIWGVGNGGDSGYGQSTTLSTVSVGATVAAINWSNLNTRITSIANHQGTTITSRTNPVTGNLIQILTNLGSDINTCYTNRGNASLIGTEYGVFSGTTTKTTATGSGGSSWTITFTHTVTFPSANAARYFWNGGGLVRIQYGKSSTGTDHDPDWNTLAGQCGSIYISGRVNSSSQLIAGTTYTGTTRIGGTGGTQTTLATTTGWYNLIGTPTIFQLNNASAPYTDEYIRTTATATSTTVLTLVTTWFDGGTGVIGSSSNISGGSAITSPATSISGANVGPTTLVTYFPPSSTYLTNTWGTPVISASVS